MACINLNIQNAVGSCLSANVERVSKGINANVYNTTSSSKAIVTDAIKEHLTVRCSIVCSLAEAFSFLRVTPTDVQWITDDMGVFFDVESNVDWVILID